MRISYDPTVDAFALRIESAKVVNTIDQGGGVFIDVDEAGKVLGVEVLDASTHFDAESLAQLRAPRKGRK